MDREAGKGIVEQTKTQRVVVPQEEKEVLRRMSLEELIVAQLV
jgi:hypothetical protein